MSAARDRLDALARFEHARLKHDTRALIDHAGAASARIYRKHRWAAVTLGALGGAALAASWLRRRSPRRRLTPGVIASSLLGLVRTVAVQLGTAAIAAAQIDRKSTVTPRRAVDPQPTRVE